MCVYIYIYICICIGSAIAPLSPRTATTTRVRTRTSGRAALDAILLDSMLRGIMLCSCYVASQPLAKV